MLPNDDRHYIANDKHCKYLHLKALLYDITVRNYTGIGIGRHITVMSKIVTVSEISSDNIILLNRVLYCYFMALLNGIQ
jgi:hypothetical protein